MGKSLNGDSRKYNRNKEPRQQQQLQVNVKRKKEGLESKREGKKEGK